MKAFCDSVTLLGLMSTVTQALSASFANSSVTQEVEIKLCHDSKFQGSCTIVKYQTNQGCMSFPADYGSFVSSLSVRYNGEDWDKMHCTFWSDDVCQGRAFRVGNGQYAKLPKKVDDKLNSVYCKLDGVP